MSIVLEYIGGVKNTLLKETVQFERQSKRSCKLGVDTVVCCKPTAFATSLRPFSVDTTNFSGTGEQGGHRDG